MTLESLIEHLRSPLVFGAVRVAYSSVFCVVQCVLLFVFLSFSFLVMSLSVYFRFMSLAVPLVSFVYSLTNTNTFKFQKKQCPIILFFFITKQCIRTQLLNNKHYKWKYLSKIIAALNKKNIQAANNVVQSLFQFTLIVFKCLQIIYNRKISMNAML